MVYSLCIIMPQRHRNYLDCMRLYARKDILHLDPRCMIASLKSFLIPRDPPPVGGIKLVHPNRCLSRTNSLRWGRLTVSATRRFGEKKRGGTLKRVLTIQGRSSTLGSSLAANQVRGCPGLMTAAALARGEHGAPGLIPRGSLTILLVAVAYPVRRGPRSYWFVSFHSGSLLYSLCLGRAWPRKAQSRGGGIDYDGGISSCQDFPGIHLCASDINVYIHVAI